MEDLIQGMVEGELRQRIICNTCGHAETLALHLEPDEAEEAAGLIRDDPAAYWRFIRLYAFLRGWVCLPDVNGESVSDVSDLCPACFTLLRNMSRVSAN